MLLHQSQQAEVAKRAPNLKACATDIPAAFFGTYTGFSSTENLTIVHVADGDRQCKNGSFYFEYEGLDYTSLPKVATASGKLYPRKRFNASRSYNGYSFCDSPCSGAGITTEVRSLHLLSLTPMIGLELGEDAAAAE